MTIHDNMPLSHHNSALILDNEKAICNIHATSIGTLSGILFDMDGTLIDSTNAIVKFWTRYSPFVTCYHPLFFSKLRTNKTPQRRRNIQHRPPNHFSNISWSAVNRRIQGNRSLKCELGM
jgi:hypothetical protein